MVIIFFVVYAIVAGFALAIMIHYELEIRRHKKEIVEFMKTMTAELRAFQEQTESDLSVLEKKISGK